MAPVLAAILTAAGIGCYVLGLTRRWSEPVEALLVCGGAGLAVNGIALLAAPWI